MADASKPDPTDASQHNEVFISYSRRNLTFVKQLASALKRAEIDPWFDMEDIPKTADWWEEIRSGIEAANAFIFVISPDSLKSKICHNELVHARRYNKRIIPIMYVDVFAADTLADIKAQWASFEAASSPEANWEALQALNFIFMRDGDDKKEGLRELLRAIRTDLDYLKTHSRLLVRAREWETKGRGSGYLLRGEDLTESEAWVKSAARKLPPVTDLHKLYIAMSRRAASNRRRTLMGSGVVAFLIIIVVGAMGIVEAGRRSAAEANVLIEQQGRETQAAIAATEQANAATERASAATERASRATQQSVAEREAMAAGSLDLAAQAQQHQRNGRPDQAIALALQAVNVVNPPPEAQRILAEIAAQAGTVTVYEGETGQLLDDTRVVIQRDNTLYIIDIAKGETIDRIDPIGQLSAFAVSPDGSQIVTGTTSGTLWLWTTSPVGVVNELAPEHQGEITHLAFSPDGSHILAGRYGETQWTGILQLLSVNPAEIVWSADLGVEQVRALTFAPKGRTAYVISRDGKVREFDFNRPSPLRTFESSYFWNVGELNNYSITASPNGRLLAVAVEVPYDGLAGVSFGLDFGSTAIHLLDLETGAYFNELRGHTADVRNVAFSPDGKLLLSSDVNGQIIVWDTATWQARASIYGLGAGAIRLSFTSDSHRALAAGQDNTLRLLDLVQDGEITVIQGNNALGDYQDIAFNPEGRILLSGNSLRGAVTLLRYDMLTGRVLPGMDSEGVIGYLATRPGHHEAWAEVAPMGLYRVNLVTGASEIVMTSDAGPRSIFFSGDGQRIALGTRESMTIHNPDDLTITYGTIEGNFVHDPFTDELPAAQLNMDGTLVARVSDPQTIHIREVNTGQLVHNFTAEGEIYWVQFEEADRLIYAVTGDTTRIVRRAISTGAEEILIESAQKLESPTLTTDGGGLIAVTRGTLQLWRFGDIAPIRQEPLDGAMSQIVPTADGMYAVLWQTDVLRLIRLPSTLDKLVGWVCTNRYVAPEHRDTTPCNTDSSSVSLGDAEAFALAPMQDMAALQPKLAGELSVASDFWGRITGGSVGNAYTYQNTFPGEQVAITMTAENEDFDPYLELYDPAGNLVAHNDNDEGLNARIASVSLDTVGVYKIVARGSTSVPGSYYVRLDIMADHPGVTVPTTAPQTTTSCPGALPDALVIGGRGRVLPGPSNNLREEPFLDSPILTKIPGGGVFTVLDGPYCEYDYAFWKVNYEGVIGWTAQGHEGEYWVEPY